MARVNATNLPEPAFVTKHSGEKIVQKKDVRMTALATVNVWMECASVMQGLKLRIAPKENVSSTAGRTENASKDFANVLQVSLDLLAIERSA